MFEIFARNFVRFDVLIFALAASEALIMHRCFAQARRLRKLFFPTGYLPGGRAMQEELGRQVERYLSRDGEAELTRLYRRVGLLYSLYENITGIFPLMGILGTVISLIPMVNLVGTETTNLFFSALTSTFWGIVFAIVYKALNGWLAAEIEHCQTLVALYLERNSLAERPAQRAAAAADYRRRPG